MVALSYHVVKNPRHTEKPWHLLGWWPWMNMPSSLLSIGSGHESRGLQIILALGVSPDVSLDYME